MAAVVACLASDGAAFVTGTALSVDGGRYVVLVDDQYAGYPLFDA